MTAEGKEVLDQLSPTQEHFLKKYLLENRLTIELHELSKPGCCQLLGPPFKIQSDKEGNNNDEDKHQSLPLLSFFFKQFVTEFPFITNNSPKDQLNFWQNTVQPFIEKFNQGNISSSDERRNNITKRKQVNKKFLSGLLLFFNSTLITDKDLIYQNQSHLKASDTGKIDKLQKSSNEVAISMAGLHEYELFQYKNDISINIVSVRDVSATSVPAYTSWNPLRYLRTSDTQVQTHNFDFILQITTRMNSLDGDVIKYKSHFIPRHYHEFKLLSQSLKKAYPGLMASKSFDLPVKSKSDQGINSQEYEPSISSKVSENSGQSNSLYREKLRLALRGYLRSLISRPEIVHSKEFLKFINDENLIFQSLTVDDLVDYNKRLESEKKAFVTQLEFQHQASKVMLQLSSDFDEFKSNLIMKPDTILKIFEDIEKSSSIKSQSKVIRTFNEWCKLEVAATIYQMFLSQDNSGEWLNKCRRFHRLFPYNVVYGILRFTNPVKIVGKVIDLLLMNIPTISFSGSEKGETRNLLSIIFTLLLDEDLTDFEKELTALREDKLDTDYDVFLERIEAYCQLDTNIVDDIREESMIKSQDFLLTILSTELILPRIQTSLDQFKFNKIKESYEAYSHLNEDKDVTKSELYLNLKQYWQVQIRKKDTNLLKQLWKEPELTRLLKDSISIFYQPLIRVFAKADMHVVFRSFQIFMDDLMKDLYLLSNKEIYYLNPFQIFERIKGLLDKHEEVLWEFLHNVYVHDEQHLFKGIVKWTEKFLLFLRLKFVNEEAVKLIISLNGVSLNEELFIKQLNAQTNRVVEKRRLFKEYFENKSLIGKGISAQDKIDEGWEDVNGKLFGDTSAGDFGVNQEDFEEFNNMHAEADLDADGTLDNDLKKKLLKLEEDVNEIGTSELDKLDGTIKTQLSILLKDINL
ncbi:uncharacterized protein RJT21DRAFT_118937 [Scheffersomyces amazonensis]|uniref:uncharacterized protein n=1 Tax=Scheffersomyces amazonensis TaxID=1078765 RepID=UPI00315DCA0A